MDGSTLVAIYIAIMITAIVISIGYAKAKNEWGWSHERASAVMAGVFWPATIGYLIFIGIIKLFYKSINGATELVADVFRKAGV